MNKTISILLILLFLLVMGSLMAFAAEKSYQWIRPVNIAYGEAFVNQDYDNATFMAIGAVDTFYNITGLRAGRLERFTLNETTGGLTVEIEGVYIIHYTVSFEPEVSGGPYGVKVSKNFNSTVNLDCPCYMRRTGTSVGTTGVTCIMELENGDTINPMIADEDSPIKDINIHSLNLNVNRVGDLPD